MMPNEAKSQNALQLAQVAEIIDNYKVVINKGADDGVKSGHTYLFYSLGPEIMDPSTNVSLGRLELLRGNGNVVHVQPKMSIVRSLRRKPVYGPSGATSFGAIFGTTREPISYEELPFEEIAIGDFARPI
jgi:hypothetical protein